MKYNDRHGRAHANGKDLFFLLLIIVILLIYAFYEENIKTSGPKNLEAPQKTDIPHSNSDTLFNDSPY